MANEQSGFVLPKGTGIYTWMVLVQNGSQQKPYCLYSITFQSHSVIISTIVYMQNQDYLPTIMSPNYIYLLFSLLYYLLFCGFQEKKSISSDIFEKEPLTDCLSWLLWFIKFKNSINNESYQVLYLYAC